MRILLALAACALAIPVSAADLAEGNWRLNFAPSPIGDIPALIVKVEKKDGKYSATSVAAGNAFKFDSFTVQGDTVQLATTYANTRKWTFEATIGTDGKQLRGSYGDASILYPATLNATPDEKLAPTNPAGMGDAPEPFAKVQKLNQDLVALQRKLIAEKDADNKAELTKQFREMRKDLEAKAPGLWRETVDKHSKSPYALAAATSLIPVAAKAKASPQDVASWTKMVMTDATSYGAKYSNFRALGVAETLAPQKAYASIALELATPIYKAMKESDSVGSKVRILKVMKYSQLGAGKLDDAKATDSVLAKLESALDTEYLKKGLPFTPTAFAGRKDGANRVAVMELFTGAQCPPCVAADVAFDALEKTYKHTDVVLLQYHMHIPGPDPLTNLDTIARWDYYVEKFPDQVRGTPTPVFNGKPQPGGGGGMAQAERSYGMFKKAIETILEDKTTVKFTGNLKSTGDKIALDLGVEGVEKPGSSTKLRVIVVEETVRYLGSNGLRFHHHVVRAMPGGIKGYPVTDKTSKHTVEIDLKQVRASISKYLDEYSMDRPFSNLDRPIDLKNLKVIALVQNDETGEILNAAEWDVK